MPPKRYNYRFGGFFIDSSSLSVPQILLPSSVSKKAKMSGRNDFAMDSISCIVE